MTKLQVYGMKIGEWGWGSCESICLLPGWPSFVSRKWQQTWVCCWFSALFREVFLREHRCSSEVISFPTLNLKNKTEQNGLNFRWTTPLASFGWFKRIRKETWLMFFWLLQNWQDFNDFHELFSIHFHFVHLCFPLFIISYYLRLIPTPKWRCFMFYTIWWPAFAYVLL